MAMIKKCFKLILALIIFSSLIFAIRLKQKSIDSKNAKPIISFFSQWKEKGKPVYVHKVNSLDLNHKIKMTISCKDNRMFYAYVSKELLDKLTEDNLVFFDIENIQAQGKIESLKSSLDRYTGLYRVEGLLSSDFDLTKSRYIADVYAGKDQNVIIVPQASLETLKGQEYVWVINDNKCFKKNVTVKDQKGEVVLIQDGINAGDLVVVKGGKELKENDKVYVINSGEKR
jgi:hypothetical protein